ncbi:MAG: hypothetical protein QM635_04275 [Microbacteriaceae bacterium]
MREHGYGVEELARVVAMRPEEFAARFDLDMPGSGGRQRRAIQ